MSERFLALFGKITIRRLLFIANTSGSAKILAKNFNTENS